MVSELLPEKIHIVDFRIVKGEIESPFDFDRDLVKGHSSKVNFDLEFRLEDKFVKANFHAEILTDSDKAQSKESKGLFEFVFIYHVENLEKLTKSDPDDQTISIDGTLGNALASITYSTSRGIIMTRFQGTGLEKFVLPVINPNDLLKD